MNLLLIGFRYQEVKALQDRLQVELPQLKLDFAISVRDCWHRFKFSSYDLLLLDASGADLTSFSAYQEIVAHSETIPIVVLTDSQAPGRLEAAVAARNDFLLIKDGSYVAGLLQLLKKKTAWPSPKIDSAHRVAVTVHPQRSWQYFWAAMNINSNPLVIISAHFELVEANDAFFDSFQLLRTQTIGKKCYQQLRGLTQPCREADGACPLSEVQQSRSVFSGACLCLKKDKASKTIKSQARPIFNDANQLDQVMISFQPAAPAPKSDMPSLFDRSLLDLMLSGLSDGIIFCNAENRIIFLNRTAEIILGMPKEKVVGRTVFDLPLADGSHWLSEVLSTLNVGARFNSIAFKTMVRQQLVQIRFAPVYGTGKLYMGGFLYLTELADLMSKESQHVLSNDQEKFQQLKQAAFSKSIAEG